MWQGRWRVTFVQYKCYEGESTLKFDFVTSNYCTTDEVHRKRLYCGLAVCDGARCLLSVPRRLVGRTRFGHPAHRLALAARARTVSCALSPHLTPSVPRHLAPTVGGLGQMMSWELRWLLTLFSIVKGLWGGGGTHTVIILQLQLQN